MVTFLITSVLLLGLIAIAIYYWQKPANTSETIELPPARPTGQGLFSDVLLNETRTATTSNQIPETTHTVDGARVRKEDFEQTVAAIRDFQQSPNRTTTAKLLHVAAETDDAKTYGRAIELVLMSWRDRSLTDVSAGDLQALFNSAYWVLSSRSRTSGAGFVLKQTLSNANRELEGTNHN
ncbi:MAG TPA: hypothetical protein VFR51_16615 [Pyrinomonadaceae bacterium]|nr:hypothetical protein [Pyrinomonadaceae bacterium]